MSSPRSIRLPVRVAPWVPAYVAAMGRLGGGQKFMRCVARYIGQFGLEVG